MDEIYLDNLLLQCGVRHVEKHSDSSDFENSYEVPIKDNTKPPVVVFKDGSHTLMKNKTSKKRKHDVVTRRLCNDFQLYTMNTEFDRDNIPEKETTYPQKQVCNNNVYSTNMNEKEIKRMSNNIHKSEKTFQFKDKACSSRISVKSKIVPSLSKILKNCKTHSNPDNYSYVDADNGLQRERSRKKKSTKPHKHHSHQSVYVVANEAPGFPFQRRKEYVELSQIESVGRHNSSDFINECVLSSGSEQENIKPYKHKKLMKYIMDRLEKQMKREIADVGKIKHEKQQYPSKLHISSPYQVFTTSSCQTKSASTDSESYNAVPSNSSEFWDFLFQKIKYQIHKAEVPKYTTKTCCDKESCQFFKKNSSNNSLKPNPKSKGTKQNQKKDDPCFKNLSPSSSQLLPKKKSQDSGVICKCLKPNKSYSPDKIKPQDGTRPCQEEHDTLTKTLADKYNAEILCIHNPPCVLINGCLNLPQPKSATPQGTLFFPVTQPKRSSFAQICRKIKRSKQKNQDQAIQYQTPTIDIQEYLPEFRTEKIVQSVCNHSPPCAVMRGCQKPRFNPTLQTSCVHVPMCPKYPECVLEQRNEEIRTCVHTPKCAELPLCTRKYIALTAKENAMTQVKPKTKIGCRHQPPCLMIPKCLAQVICGDSYPGNAIPGCVHQPSCEMIPACFRKPVKDSVSVQSQYPSASCRIV